MSQPTTAKARAGTLGADSGLLCLGLPRTGTFSLYTALKILGYERVNHGLEMTTQEHWYAWARAAWATFPFLKTPHHGSRPPHYLEGDVPKGPYTRADWDVLVGDYEAVTDLCALFGPELMDAYPRAKVLVVERDVEPWIRSWTDVFLEGFFAPWDWFVMGELGPRLLNKYQLRALWDVNHGWSRVTGERGEDAPAKLRRRYREHYAAVRDKANTGAGQHEVLEYKLSDGWEPLCAFLGKPVPDVPFPRVNDKDMMAAFRKGFCRYYLLLVLAKFAKYGVVLGAVGYAIWRREEAVEVGGSLLSKLNLGGWW